MQKFCIILIVLLVASWAKAQSKQPCSSCLPEGITFTSQAQVDSFQINNPNCTYVEGNVIINNLWSGTDITNLDGLSVLTSIGGTLRMQDNDYLINITGLINLHSIGGALHIDSNPALTSLSGLDSVSSVGGMVIESSEGLTNLTGLGSLSAIYGDCIIEFNHHLTNLAGLDNLNSIEGNVRIKNNTLVNFTGLESLNFIGGNVIIHNGWGLSSLTGLENLTSIGGYLHFFNDNSLTNLTGLNNLNYIGGYLLIDGNSGLVTLTGLESLDSIGGELKIGMNDTLISLAALSNLNLIGGNLVVFQNNSLTNLTGLDNINAESIIDLYFTDNIALSTCDVLSVCNYLASPNGVILLYGNAIGCTSQQEIEAACGVGLDESAVSDQQSAVNIYPNPASSLITISTPAKPDKNTFMTIYNISGQQLIQRQITEQQTVVDVSGLPQGVYFLRIRMDTTVQMGKFVKE